VIGDADITIGELSRTIAAMDGRLTSQLQEVNRRLDGLQFVHRETYEAQREAFSTRLATIEEKDTWRGRALVVSFLFPVLIAVVLALALGK
jgi:Mg-chelatase subunit ChlI